ncbi:hypothetical protein ES703_114701 [subsurface metagenome]
MAEVDQRGDAVSDISHAAGHDGREVREVGLDVDGDAVEGNPAAQAHADRGDLVLMASALIWAFDPDADAVLAPFAADVEMRQRADDPFLQPRHIGAHVGPAALEVEHHIGDALAGPVIGELAAAAGREQGKAGVEQVLVLAAGPRGVERGVLQQPDQFARPPGGDIGRAGLHRSHRLEIGHGRIGDPPFDGGAPGRARKRRQIQALAVINHWLTITWSGSHRGGIPRKSSHGSAVQKCQLSIKSPST